MKRIKKFTLIILAIVGIGLLIPQNLKMPVKGATSSSYNHKSFWAYPWGKSVTHKGVDIFAKKGAAVISATSGIVLLADHRGPGGKYVVVLGPKWRLHYYAHLNEIKTTNFKWVNNKTPIGTVGNTGNAMSTPPHLHYSIMTPIPYPWRIDNSIQGWKKMFTLNPIKYLKQ